ncbi:MAG TPA: hypothetical protein PLF26_08270 [Blastocatellia bacterium]|nr:hypothetical protein [Blastocatellia bacterium]
MGMLIGLLGIVVYIATLVCLVMVLIKLFQVEGALKGILGIICGLYTFVWGWMNADKLNIKNIMLAWTVLIIIMIVLQVVGGAAMYGS